MSCVDAKELNNFTLNHEDAQDLGVKEETNEDLSLSADEKNLNTEESLGDENSQAYLVLDNDADNENIYIGDYVTWNIEVTNEGPGNAINVRVFDQLPDGLKYVGHYASKGTFDPETGIWEIGNMSNGEYVFLDILTQAISEGEKINKATLTCDSINLNNETYEEEEIDVFEHHDDIKDKDKHVLKNIKSTGNPIFLVVISLFVCFIGYIKR